MFMELNPLSLPAQLQTPSLKAHLDRTHVTLISNLVPTLHQSLVLRNASLRNPLCLEVFLFVSRALLPKQYSVVTNNITMTLDPTCGQVKEQVGFEVVLLDSKCYPILSNEDTSIPDFWRSTRKIIAASQQAYEKLGGIPPEMDLCKQMEERDESELPKKRAWVKGKEKMDDRLDSTHGSLDEVIKKLESIERKMSFLMSV